jgi:hypothetical protein
LQAALVGDHLCESAALEAVVRLPEGRAEAAEVVVAGAAVHDRLPSREARGERRENDNIGMGEERRREKFEINKMFDGNKMSSIATQDSLKE